VNETTAIICFGNAIETDCWRYVQRQAKSFHAGSQ